MSLRVSVVVPTYKRNQLLHNCLDALVNQNLPPCAYEIIVVDDDGSEETRSLVESYSKTVPASGFGPETDLYPQLTYAAATQTQGPAAARNLGWRMARGEIIAFTDDDCLPEPDWLKEGVAAINDEMDGVSGQVIVPVPDEPTDYERNVARLAMSEFVTANCFYRRSALESCGGFDEQFTMAWREDSDLFFKMLSRSCKLGYTSAAKVVHPVRPAPWGISLKEQRKSMFNALLFKKYPEMYRKLIQSRPPLRYYAIVLSTPGFILALLAGKDTLAWLMILLWVGLIMHFTFQRLRDTKHTLSHILEMLVTSLIIPYLSAFWRLRGALQYRVWFF